jgi:chromobox protein 1
VKRSSETSGSKGVSFKPPTGSWEESVEEINVFKETDGSVNAYLTWKGGKKTIHALDVVYKRCPQKVKHTARLSQMCIC